MKVRLMLATALLAGVALLTLPVPAAGQTTGTAPPGETPAERIARETIAAVRASERAELTTSLAPVPRRQVVAGPLAGRWTTCQLPEGFNPVHASVLPDGTVLLMAGSGNDPADFAAGRFQSYLFSQRLFMHLGQGVWASFTTPSNNNSGPTTPMPSARACSPA